MDHVEAYLTRIEKEIKQCIPGQSIDCVVLGFEDNALKILLLKRTGSEKWALPGGFVNQKESLDSAANRVLEDRTGLKSIYLSQFHTFGNHNRRNQAEIDEAFQQLGPKFHSLVQWFSQRFITTAYFAFADISKATPIPDFISEKCEWIDIQKMPELIIDHKGIVEKALEHIKVRLNYLPIGYSLLPAKFTMSFLQKLYESILGRKLDRANFQKKMLKLGIFERHEKLHTGAANKAPFLYSFHVKKYNDLLERGIGYL